MTTPARTRLAAPTICAAVLAVIAVLLALALVLIGIPAHQNELANFGQEIAAGPLLAVLGFLIVRKQRGNKIGWLMQAAAVGLPLTGIGQPYALMNYRLGYRLPFGLAAMLVAYSWIVPLAALAVAIMLFPDGSLPSPRCPSRSRARVLPGRIPRSTPGSPMSNKTG